MFLFIKGKTGVDREAFISGFMLGQVESLDSSSVVSPKQCLSECGLKKAFWDILCRK